MSDLRSEDKPMIALTPESVVVYCFGGLLWVGIGISLVLLFFSGKYSKTHLVYGSSDNHANMVAEVGFHTCLAVTLAFISLVLMGSYQALTRLLVGLEVAFGYIDLSATSKIGENLQIQGYSSALFFSALFVLCKIAVFLAVKFALKLYDASKEIRGGRHKI